MRGFHSRSLVVLVALTLTDGGLRAAPVPGASTTAESVLDRETMRAESRKFALSLVGVVDRISEEYYRPVKREELLLTALTGLYQAARKPVPRDLKGRIREAIGPADAITTTSANIPAPGTASGELPVHKLVRDIREEIGDAEVLGGQSSLVICAQAMARSLDQHSGIVTSEEQQRTLGLDLESDGVGLELTDNGIGPVVIESVHPGGPAQRAGLRPGDRITQIDGKPYREVSPASQNALRNQRVQAALAPLVPGEAKPELPPPPRQVRITIERPNEKEPRTLELSRARYHPETVLGVRRRDDNSWIYLADEKKGIAHIRISHLSRGTAEELRHVLTELRDQKLTGLVLDLRWCPGGYLQEAVDVADLFLGAAVIATVKSRNRDEMTYRSADAGEDEKFRKFPVVVLVNGATMGGAELIAAALQDHHRATVVGQRTLGKASVQTPVALDMTGIGLKLTSGTFIRPSGKNLHRHPESGPGDEWGVKPDAVGDFRVSPELTKRLKEWWQRQTLRPGSSNERLPLDDPRAEPQQMAALGVLRRMMEKGE
jgi:carboxyl-terminal processing protease